MTPDIQALQTGSSLQRDGLNHQAIEDYLKTIYILEQEESPVSTSRVAAARNVQPGSATSMIQRLGKFNLVEYKKHRGVTLTESGREIALEVLRHHRLVELYLMEALGFSWDEVHEQADILEHVISEKLEERMAAALNYPEFDPHGDPIPSKEGVMATVDNRPLATLRTGESAVVSRIPDDANGSLLRHLADLGLVLGKRFTVSEIASIDGPMTLDIEGNEVVIDLNIARAVLVEKV
ncbi:MAG: metal-dependent transcriptional regulator [Candidatus Promineifilaceae bacterium]